MKNEKSWPRVVETPPFQTELDGTFHVWRGGWPVRGSWMLHEKKRDQYYLHDGKSWGIVTKADLMRWRVPGTPNPMADDKTEYTSKTKIGKEVEYILKTEKHSTVATIKLTRLMQICEDLGKPAFGSISVNDVTWLNKERKKKAWGGINPKLMEEVQAIAYLCAEILKAHTNELLKRATPKEKSNFLRERSNFLKAPVNV